MNLQGCTVIEKVFKKDRWCVVLDRGNGVTRTMPQYRYNWLVNNPSFESIPKGYAVHHLDYDKTNDDPSNLALMQRYHHVAHHWKHKKIETKVKIRIDPRAIKRNGYYPVTEPEVCYNKQQSCWCLRFFEDHGEELRRRYISTYRDKKFKSKEDAEKAKREIWSRFQED